MIYFDKCNAFRCFFHDFFMFCPHILMNAVFNEHSFLLELYSYASNINLLSAVMFCPFISV